MVQQQYTTKRRKGQHLTLIERGKIEAFLKIGMPKNKIASEIGISTRTLYREINRGMVKGLLNSDYSTYDAYSAEFAHKKYLEAMKGKEGTLKIGKNRKLIEYVENSMLNDRNSPYVALEKAKKENIEVNICLKTLYNYIHKELFINFSEEDMIYKKDRRKQERIPKRIRKIGGKSIEKRPEEINNRQELGHFEADTVLGKRGTKEAILVLTDRKTRLEMVRKIPDKTAESVIKELSKIITEYPGMIKSITSDNGSEFMRADKIEEENIAYYYAHSYSSWERGSNENNNKLIRRFIPKGTDISEISEEEIKQIEKWMNDYPRKIFNGKSSNEMYLREFTKYFS